MGNRGAVHGLCTVAVAPAARGRWRVPRSMRLEQRVLANLAVRQAEWTSTPRHARQLGLRYQPLAPVHPLFSRVVFSAPTCRVLLGQSADTRLDPRALIARRTPTTSHPCSSAPRSCRRSWTPESFTGLVRALRGSLGVPGVHGNGLSPSGRRPVGDKPGLLLEDRQNARSSLLDHLILVAPEAVNHTSPIRHRCHLFSRLPGSVMVLRRSARRQR